MVVTTMETLNCGICKRPLNLIEDPLSVNCGGDCLRCMANIERENPVMTGWSDLELSFYDHIIYLENLILKIIKENA